MTGKRGVIRVLIADDHPIVCMGLAAMIATQPDMELAGQASDGLEAIQLFRSERPDVILMDLRMPNCGGVEAIRSIRELSPNAAFIVLTTYQGDEDIHRALTAGAHGYLLKGMPHRELLRAIRDVHAGQRYLPPAILKSLANRAPDQLSPRELEILRLMSKGFSNRRIANELGITEGTVKWHVNIILSRLHVSDRTQAVVAAVQRGIVDL